MPATAPRWRALSATATGSNHLSGGRACQDAFAVSDSSRPGAPVVAVADGHGHRLHFRSQRGAEIAVASACQVVADHSGSLARVDDPETFIAEARRVVIAGVMDHWRKSVRQDLDQSPVTESELLAAGLSAGEWEQPEPFTYAETTPYGTTLLLAAVIGPHLLMAQVGDGDIFGFSPEGATSTPVPGDPSLDGVRTTSMCQASASGSFRLAVIDLRETPVAGVALATDGYGNAQTDNDWQQEVGAGLAELIETRGVDFVGSQMQGWVERCASATGSGDDTTLVLLLPTTPVQQAPADKTNSPPRPNLTAKARPTPAHRRRRAVATLAAVAVLVVVIGGVALALGGGHTGGRSGRSSPSSLSAIERRIAEAVTPARTLPATDPATHRPVAVTLPSSVGWVTDHLQEGNYLVLVSGARVWRIPVVPARGYNPKSARPITKLDSDLYPIDASKVTVTSSAGKNVYIIDVGTMDVCQLNSAGGCAGSR